MTTNEPKIRDLALKLIEAKEKYFEASRIARRLHAEWIDVCNRLASAMLNERAECVLVDGRVVVFRGHEAVDDPITSAFSVYKTWPNEEPTE
jgi:hypothetical protein